MSVDMVAANYRDPGSHTPILGLWSISPRAAWFMEPEALNICAYPWACQKHWLKLMWFFRSIRSLISVLGSILGPLIVGNSCKGTRKTLSFGQDYPPILNPKSLETNGLAAEIIKCRFQSYVIQLQLHVPLF